MSISAWFRARSARKQLHEDAHRAVREASSILRRYGHRIPEETAREVRSAVEDVDSAFERHDVAQSKTAVARLEEKIERHLSWGRKSSAREWAESVAVAVFVAMLLRLFVVEAFKIPSGSMLPTLEIGDHLFVNKFIYGLQVPFSHRKLVHFASPQRGDVIVFIYPRDESKDFIKRVVAIGGDEIEVRDNRVILNGVAVERRPLRRVCRFDDRDEMEDQWISHPCVAYEEWIDSHHFQTIETPTGSLLRNYAKRTVPTGHVFVMGDNRDNSSDSRYWGTVPLPYIKGKAMFIWWSWGPGGFRWNRLFRGVHREPPSP